MLFTSSTFYLFLSLIVVLYYTLFKKYQWQLLLVASVIFYASYVPVHLVYILITIVSTYFAAIKVEENKKASYIVYIVIGLNLLLLSIFKYGNNISELMSGVNIYHLNNYTSIIIPLGISYYTFMSIAYLIDVKRSAVSANKNIFKLALFLSFFPHILIGPITKYGQVKDSLYSTKKYDSFNVQKGILRIIWGLFKKVVVADRLIRPVLILSQGGEEYKGIYVLILMVLYSYRIYCDFTGGIDIAIGTASLFGVRLPENFIRPYFSKSIIEYWRRWHITLASFFRNYVFFPLSVSKPMLLLSKVLRKHFGNNVAKKVPMYLSITIVWSLTGLWHGGSLNFLFWGLFNALFIIIEIQSKPFIKSLEEKYSFLTGNHVRALQIMTTLVIVSSIRLFDIYDGVGMVFNRFFSIFTDFKYVDSQTMLLNIGLSGADIVILTISFIVLLSFSLLQRKADIFDKVINKKLGLRLAVIYSLVTVIVIFGAYGENYDVANFIYNRF